MKTGTTNRPWGAMFARGVAFLAGVAIIGCVTHYAIAAIGGYRAAGAPLLMAMAAGLVVGAAVVGLAWQGRKILACLTAFALLCGESYALINTAERTLEQREQRLEPLRRAENRRTELREAISKGETERAAMTTTARIEQALAAQQATNAKALETIAGKTCMDRCKETIEKSKAADQKEIDAARTELDAQRRAVEAKIEDAKAELEAMPVPGTQGILAATLGVDAWKIDLLAAALLSIAANGLGALLVAFSAHPSRKPERVVAIAVSVPANDEVPLLDPGPGTPSQADADPVIDWCRAYRAKHGRLPQIPEVQREFQLSKTTAWRRIKAA